MSDEKDLSNEGKLPSVLNTIYQRIVLNRAGRVKKRRQRALDNYKATVAYWAVVEANFPTEAEKRTAEQKTSAEVRNEEVNSNLDHKVRDAELSLMKQQKATVSSEASDISDRKEQHTALLKANTGLYDAKDLEVAEETVYQNGVATKINDLIDKRKTLNTARLANLDALNNMVAQKIDYEDELLEKGVVVAAQLKIAYNELEKRKEDWKLVLSTYMEEKVENQAAFEEFKSTGKISEGLFENRFKNLFDDNEFKKALIDAGDNPVEVYAVLKEQLKAGVDKQVKAIVNDVKSGLYLKK